MNKPKPFRYAAQWKGSPTTTNMSPCALKREQRKLQQLVGQGRAPHSVASHPSAT